MDRESLTIRTSLGIDECRRRLEAALTEQRATLSYRLPLPELQVPLRGIRRTVALARGASGRFSAMESIETVVDGKLSDRSVMLWVIRQLEGKSVANSFAPRLYARLEECPGGSCIGVSFRVAAFARAFLAVWVSGVLAVEGFVLYGLAAGWERHASVWVILGFPVVFLAAGFGLLRFLTWLGRGDRSPMLEFLKRVLDGVVEHVD